MITLSILNTLDGYLAACVSPEVTEAPVPSRCEADIPLQEGRIRPAACVSGGKMLEERSKQWWYDKICLKHTQKHTNRRVNSYVQI